MSFGFGIGDFITVIELADKVRKQFVNAPGEFEGISAEVRSLTIILRDVDVALSEYEPDEKQKKDLQNIASGCQSVLNDLEKALGKYSELASKERGINKTAKRVWKKLTWEPDDIRDLRGRITSNITLLNSFNQQSTTTNVVKLVRRQDYQESQEILDWITPFDYASQHADFVSRRQPDTGKWFLESQEYQLWMRTKKQTLFCPGIPGAGKTILTSIVIDDVSDRFRDDLSVGVAYIYGSFRRKSEQRTSDLLSSLLKQLSQRQSSLPDSVKDLYNRHTKERRPLSEDQISRTLGNVVSLYSKVFIIIDALDECQASDGCRAKLISVIFGIQKEHDVNILVTSRFNPDVEDRFAGCASLEIRAGEDDVSRYLEGHMELLPIRNPAIEKEILTTIPEIVDGMFLLSQIYFDSLKAKTTPKAIRKALRGFQRENQEPGEDKKLQVLSQAYDDAMDRIKGQGQGFKDLAFQVLMWITFSSRPLTTLELRHALAVEIDEEEFDEENLTTVELMVSVCAGLVTIEKESGVIRLVHYTTQEYFDKTQGQWFPEAQLTITNICLAYLSLPNFASGSCETEEEIKQRLESAPFYTYAARYWGHHTELVPKNQYQEVLSIVLTFLGKPAHTEASSQVLPDQSSDLKGVIGIHLAAYFGLGEALNLLINTENIEAKDSQGRTPLFWAVWRTRENAVQILLEKGADVNNKTNDGKSILSLVEEIYRTDIIYMLLRRQEGKGDFESSVDREFEIVHGREVISQLLRDRGAEI
ncbi:uncharacterized protein GGS22DRAFT_195456 [Annulohypoxylon maeteangense]|uniref:uncharacterized protein n=1 Tax=Annulohypoxylon maeteangense TaxID=1927788 RepID=UPI002007DD88|nr:uncharacterized protein GGS22DRAFT_195456 [Annulohypoxylon maeteangense]KAI0883266.1 hypothetical protein GGS22DRAFT_195456 [Annulohypoxylon maeteangense]